VERVAGPDDAHDRTEALLREERGAALVYVRTRKAAEELAERFGAFRPAAAYHAGLAARRRQDVHDGFLAGTVEVVVATSAFGMGVDKPDVRLVVHPHGAPTLDDYHQQIGRCGRDGEPARAVLLHRPEDTARWKAMTTGPRFTADELTRLVTVLDGLGGAADVEDLAAAAGARPGRVALAVTWLEEGGAAVVEPDGTVRLSDRDRSGAGDGGTAAAVAFEARADVQRTRLAMVDDYADGPGCRRVRLLGYFGQAYDPPCGNCDRCDQGEGLAGSGTGLEEGTHGHDGPFPVGTVVEHEEWGRGEVLTIEDDRLTVLFDAGGYRTLSLELVAEGDLLRAVER
jgi:ATP-dependent DNA helicase RecQ